MHDQDSIRTLANQDILDRIQKIDQKINGVSYNNTSGTLELLMYQKELLLVEMQERQMIEAMKNAEMSSWVNLTIDPLDLKKCPPDSKVTEV